MNITLNHTAVFQTGDFYHTQGTPTRYVKLRVAHVPGMAGMFYLLPRVSNPDMHHGTRETQVPWCMLGSLTCSFLRSRWQGKRFRHSGACANRNFAYLVRGPWHCIHSLMTTFTKGHELCQKAIHCFLANKLPWLFITKLQTPVGRLF